MKFIVINLEKSHERFAKIKRNLDSLNIPFERFNAIYGEDLTEKQIKKYSSFIGRTFLCNHGIIGCALSHVLLWKKFADSGEEFVLISEDDIEYTNKIPKFIDDIQDIYKSVGFDILSLNCSVGITGSLNSSVKFKEYEIASPIFPLTTASYVLSKKGANVLLKLINKINYHIDFEIAFQKLFNNIDYKNVKTPELLVVTKDNTSNVSVSNNGILNKLLSLLGFEKINWFLNNTTFTLCLNVSLSVYSCILIIAMILCLIQKNYILFCVISLEFTLVMIPIK